MSEASVSFNVHSGLWVAEKDGIIATGWSPEEALKKLEEQGGIHLAQPTEEDWITPANL